MSQKCCAITIDDTAASWITEVSPRAIVELLVLLDELQRRCLTEGACYLIREDSSRHLADHTRLSVAQMLYARRIRNVCAHPSTGLVSSDQLVKAIRVARRGLDTFRP
ncbi:hypothetical protein [Streptomyces uncialis]|uniref:hypothetical protein n=1 Tax=Streptomyces uncialis TaxID=1048205 RepID=UPI002F94C9C4|nr:hypothetical protein OG924_37345 [Streptomyces uncialis]